MKRTVMHLRQLAIASSLFAPRTLRQAVERLGFVQADPIRSPARAQDLILRHRVKDYRVGDLEERYPSLHLEEDFLYAYGFMQSTWRVLHPRRESKLSAAEKRVLEIVSAHRQIHPRDLEAHLGRKREINAWGGYSKATTRTLEALHYRGLLRIVGRENGIRLYESAPARREHLEPAERMRSLALLVADILAPVRESSLYTALRRLARAAPLLRDWKSAVARLIDSGQLTNAIVDGVGYIWPARRIVRAETADTVRFLAPFDPLVWDRRRFEHFWGWPYRFEAYTPAAKRKLGYYAMPLLWRDDVIGWVNASYRQGKLDIQAGFATEQPAEACFHAEFNLEIERLRRFLR
jgi:hypothetical protein